MTDEIMALRGLMELERENRELRQANKMLRKSSAYFSHGRTRPPVATGISFIDDHREVCVAVLRQARDEADLQGAADCPVDLSCSCCVACLSREAAGSCSHDAALMAA